LESRIVSSNKIVLSFAPQQGVNGVMNFGTVRYIDDNGVAYDAPVTVDSSDASGKTLAISVDTSGQWDSFTVYVQYVHAIV
jgi:hypothetical protein